MKKAVNLLLAVLLTLCVLSVNVMANGPDNVSKHDITVRYVVNTDPKLIVPEEKSVFKGESFDPLEGVSATDEEDGDLTNKVSFSKDFNLNEKGTYTITYTVTDRFGGEAVKTLTLNVIEKIAEGNTSGEVTLKENAPVEKVEAEIKSDAIVDSIVRKGAEAKSDLTADQKEAIKSGADVKLELVVDKSNPTADETSKIEKAVKNKNSNTQIGTFLDVSLLCTVTQNNSQVGSTKKVKETGTAVKVIVTVPDTLVNNDSSVNRKYDVARLHNGTVELLGATYDSASKKLTFSTDRFSTYAIVYTDTKVEQAPVYIPNKKKPVVNTGYGFDSSVIDISEGSGSIGFDVKGLKESEVLDVVLSASELVLKSKFSDSNDSLEATLSFEEARITSDGDYVLSAQLKDNTVKVAPGVYEASLKVTVTYNEYVAKIGDKYYSTIQDAIMDAPKNATEATTINILKDVNGGTSFGYPDSTSDSGRNVIIDFAGHSYEFESPAMGSTGTKSQAMHLANGNALTLKNGKLSVSKDSTVIMRMIQNYCDLTLEDMTIDCTNVKNEYNNSICRGSLTIKGNTNLIASSSDAKIFDVDGAYCNNKNYNVQVVFDETYSGTTGGVIEYVASANGHKSVLTVKAGTFTGNITSSGNTKPSITGGTFAFNPTNYVTDALIKQNTNGTYTVTSLSTDANGDYLIKDADDLILFEEIVNDGRFGFNGKTVRLTKDIDINNIEWNPIGQTGATQFQGVFDGQGHTISNMTVNNTDTSPNCASGFFGWVENTGNAVITNVKFDNANVTGNHNVGVVAGWVSGTISNCEIKNSTVTGINANDDANGDKIGGLVGYINAGIISENIVENCTIKSNRDAGGIVGAIAAGTTFANNSVKDTEVYYSEERSYASAGAIVSGRTGFSPNETNTATNVTASKLVSVSNANELSAALNAAYNSDAMILLTNDITLSDEWGAHVLNLGSNATVTIDGNEKTVSGLTTTTTTDVAGFQSNGLISGVNTPDYPNGPGSLIVKHLTIENATVSSSLASSLPTSAALIGSVNNTNINVEDVTVTGANISSDFYAGGLIGYVQGNYYEDLLVNINNCEVRNSSFNGNDATRALIALNNEPTAINGASITGNAINGGNGYSASALVGTSIGGTKATNVTASNNTFLITNNARYQVNDATYGYIYNNDQTYLVNGNEING